MLLEILQVLLLLELFIGRVIEFVFMRIRDCCFLWEFSFMGNLLFVGEGQLV